MEYVILGFLMIRDLSQYDLLQALSKNVSPFYKPSLGSIQNALKKLLRQHYILKELQEGSGRKKALYSITPEGTRYLKSWMLTEFSQSKFEAELNTRIFFLGNFDYELKRTVFSHALSYVTSELDAFSREYTRMQSITLNPNIANLAKYQIKTLEMTINQFETLSIWLKKEIVELEDQL